MRVAASLVVILFSTTNAFAEAENYEQIRVDSGMTYAQTAISERRGFGFSAEIKANVHDRLAIGGRIDVGFFFGGLFGDDNLELGFAMAGAGIAKAEYFFVDGYIRPWAGGGIGAYTIGGHTIQDGPTTTGITTTTGRYFGVAPQVGIDLGRLRLGATYHAIIGGSLEFTDMTPSGPEKRTLSQNWLSLELSLRFGGGPKRRDEPNQEYVARPPQYPPPQYPPPQYPPQQPQYPPQPQPYPPQQPPPYPGPPAPAPTGPQLPPPPTI